MLHLKQHSVQTFQPPSHANLEVWKKSPEKLGDWDLKPGDFQNMYQIKRKRKKTDYLFECFFTSSIWLRNLALVTRPVNFVTLFDLPQNTNNDKTRQSHKSK